MKVADLQGALLDYWVARADGLKVDFRTSRYRPTEYRPPNDEDRPVHAYVTEDGWTAYPEGFPQVYAPSTDWAIGGPIIEREKITCVWLGWHWTSGFQFEALSNYPWWHMTWTKDGKSQLEAAMRSYVFKKFGEEVEAAPLVAGREMG